MILGFIQLHLNLNYSKNSLRTPKVISDWLDTIALQSINMQGSSNSHQKSRRIIFLLLLTLFQWINVNCQSLLQNEIDKTSYCRFTPNHTLCLHYVSLFSYWFCHYQIIQENGFFCTASLKLDQHDTKLFTQLKVMLTYMGFLIF